MGKEIDQSVRKEALLAQSPFLRDLLSPDRALVNSKDDFLDANRRIDSSIAQSYNVNWMITLGEPIYVQGLLYKMFKPNTNFKDALIPIAGLIKFGYEFEEYSDYNVFQDEIDLFVIKNSMYDANQTKTNENYAVEFKKYIRSIVYFGTTLKLQHQKQGLIIETQPDLIENNAFTDFVNTLEMDDF